MSEGCPLCGFNTVAVWQTDRLRSYLRCADCQLVFVPPHELPSAQQARERYDLHTNSATDSGYRRYLERVADAVGELTVSNPSILDFGSGPEAVLTDIFIQRGYRCRAYDPMYTIGADALDQRYDIVVMCEVIEHIIDTRAEIERVRALLQPGGYLVIRTALYPQSVALFERWHYKSDETHIRFFSRTSIARLASLLHLKLIRHDEPLFILHDGLNSV